MKDNFKKRFNLIKKDFLVSNTAGRDSLQNAHCASYLNLKFGISDNLDDFFEAIPTIMIYCRVSPFSMFYGRLVFTVEYFRPGGTFNPS